MEKDEIWEENGPRLLGRAETFQNSALILGVIVVLLTGLVHLGWILGSAHLTSILPTFQPMVPLTALGGGLSGLSLILANIRGRPRWAGRSASSVGAVVVLIELFIPGMTALTARVGLTLGGLALIGLGRRGGDGRPEVHALGLTTGVTGLAAAIGYLFGTDWFEIIPGGSIPMALLTSIILILISSGILLATPELGVVGILRARDYGGRIARRLIPVAFLIPIVLQWLMRGGLELGLFGLSYGVSLVVTLTIVVLITVIWRVTRDLSRLDQERRRAEVSRLRLLEFAEEGRLAAQRVQREAMRRAEQEGALRRAAEAVTAAVSVDDVIYSITRYGLEGTGAELAFAERVDWETGRVEVIVSEGIGAPEPGQVVELTESGIARVIAGAEPILLGDDEIDDHPLLRELFERYRECAILLVPLLISDEGVGALTLIRGDREFGEDEIGRAQTLATLASLAFRRIQLLEDSERRNRELERVTESRARLVRGFSHDLKNPLGAADGYAELLELGVVGRLDQEGLESVRRIRVALQSARELIDDLVELARSEAGKLEIIWSETDLGKILAEAVDEHQAEADAVGLHLDLDLEAEAHLPPIMTDGRRVRQILGNLLSNAIKFTPPGGKISVGLEGKISGPGGREGEWIALSVRDSGPGISPERQALLFREFVRLNEEKGGVGLGLAISQRIARLLGGEITVESEVGLGSDFRLWLPARGRD